MRRSSPYWVLSLLLGILPTTGCLFRTRPVEDQYSKTPLKESTQQGLIDTINQQAETIRTLKATVDIDSSAGGMKKGIPSLEPQSEDLRLIAGMTVQLNTDRTWDRYFGKNQFTFMKREKLNIMTFYLGSKLVLVSTEPDFTLQQAQDLRNQIVTNHSDIQ